MAEVEARFTTEEDCPDYLVRLRWPEGFRCPRCDGSKGWPQRAVLLECADCGYQSSVTVGTVFQDTHQPLTLWFRAMWHVTSQKNGASALGLQRVLGLPISPDIAAFALRPGPEVEVNSGVVGHWETPPSRSGHSRWKMPETTLPIGQRTSLRHRNRRPNHVPMPAWPLCV